MAIHHNTAATKPAADETGAAIRAARAEAIDFQGDLTLAGAVERLFANGKVCTLVTSLLGASAGRNRFATEAKPTDFILSFVNHCNRTRLRCPNYIAPIEAIRNQAGHDAMAPDPGGQARPSGA